MNKIKFLAFFNLALFFSFEVQSQPISSTTLSPNGIRANTFYREFSQVFYNVPGLYYSELGGGVGDGRIYLRGFDERNIGFTINGIPLNNPETGEIYWSDWLGLSEVLEQINVERGMSTNQFFTPFAGGSINVKTYNGFYDLSQPEIVATYGSDNFFRTSVLFNQSLIKDKINLTALISRKVWDGYSEQTWLGEWTYYLALNGKFGAHSIGLNVFASPQKHGQRITPHQAADYEKYESLHNYNSDWGYLNGNSLNLTESHSHKPLISLHHDWKISEDFSMSNIFYTTFGKGRNTNGLIDSNLNTITSLLPYGFPYDDNGQVNFNDIWNENLNYIDSLYDPYLSRSHRIIAADNFDYFWFGYLLSGKYILNNEVQLNAGIDYRNYAGGHYGSVENLLGGDYFLDLSDENAMRTSELLQYQDDKILYDYDNKVTNVGGFAGMTYTKDALDLLLNISVSDVAYRRVDYFEKEDGGVPGNFNPEKWQHFFCYEIKTGASYNLNDEHSIYGNFRYAKKAPPFNNVLNFENTVYEDVIQESILGFDIGYQFKLDNLITKINGYLTNWGDRNISASIYDFINNENIYYSVKGADAKHMGVEFEAQYKPLKFLELNGFVSYSENKWLEDVNNTKVITGNISNTILSYVEDTYIGNYPKMLASLSASYIQELTPELGFVFTPIFKFYSCRYEYFNPDTRNDVVFDIITPGVIDLYHSLDANLQIGYNVQNMFIKKISLSFHMKNILGKEYKTIVYENNPYYLTYPSMFYGQDRSWYLNLGIDI